MTNNDMFFWLGSDGEATEVNQEAFNGLQAISKERDRRWKTIDTSAPKSYFFYGVIEDNDEADDLADGTLDEPTFNGLFGEDDDR